ncbi:hypothetical protein ACFQVD_30190 [Streptosporangium amethystogenes subsp. fukuiense]|uniref:Uncharacterized protein n=1 Tax=Streptosporangium amethystogenes subsp. fukuiense TaxID=698418 RepID=A0ABW2T7Y5_9ACTN
MKVALSVRGDFDDLGDLAEGIADELAGLQDCNESLLDFAFGSDATDSTVEFELTVEAGSVDETVEVGGSWLRTADPCHRRLHTRLGGLRPTRARPGLRTRRHRGQRKTPGAHPVEVGTGDDSLQQAGDRLL